MPDQPSKPTARPRRLGRGLAALVDQASSAVRESQAAVGAPALPDPPSPVETRSAPPRARERGEHGTELVWILLESLVPSPHQPREAMADDALDELAESIKRSGVIQPIVVRERDGKHELIAGERRWRAAQRAGLERIPAIVRNVDERTAAEWALVENLQRADLNPVERARAFQRLADEFGLTHAEIAESAGIKRPTVANTIRLLDLGDDLLPLLASGALSTGHAKVLLSVGDTSKRGALGERCAREGWTVRELERQATLTETSQPQTKSQTSTTTSRSRAVQDLEHRLGEHLSTRVAVRTNSDGSKGKLVIDFYSLDHFDDLLARLGVDTGA